MNTSKKASVLVVCMGNICRSPTGEAVLRAKAQAAGMAVEIDSAGTIGYHQGNPPDSRARAVGEARGYSFQSIRARQVVPEDFERFDLILAADRQNLADLQAMCPDQYVSKLALLLDYADVAETEVPDPYYGGPQGFEHVLDLVEQAAEGVLARLNSV
ncbi:low molecular weight protein-tyrosine-phosphatase [Photobacterium sp. 1_MG-2023]|uniref:low molecular weight protein-tyrosine-phosphatase n=1 Tax=Photobacterium sp. 1_MG-2023 TaxID=3062646 RepID=UPI0026E47D59|nr:low molecular weight protein-tyrosine-phosphatase [Photobacterium sp. 1_MG-2023]MDO6705761.1 low molecular weight protein-tyrosine-phosphatase [Photobacterium sp. 1_MG-2023]